VLAHLIGQHLGKAWGQPVIVDNRPGGNTIIGTELLARAQPDGYTIMIQNSSHVINPSLVKTPYDALADFSPIATVVTTSYLMAIHPAVRAGSVEEFVELARSKPGQFNYASTGNGSVTHLFAELFAITAGAKMAHIVYKGSSPAFVDLVAGQVHVFFSPPNVTTQFLKGGKLKALAITGSARFPSLPQIPTFAEAGLQGMNVTIWFGILAPKGIPAPVGNKLATEIRRLVSAAEVVSRLTEQGLTPLASTPGEFRTMMRDDLATFAKVIKLANIRGD
jgi:tripartite-type tricarboxylate transporter receptor subunit TctC